MMRKFLAAAVAALLLFSSPALAASRVWISEFRNLGTAANAGPAQIAQLPSVADQVLDISGGGSVASSAFNAATVMIQVTCEVQCGIKLNGTASAGAGSVMLPAGSSFYFGVKGADSVSAIANP
jgi:hypothetical protein